MPEGQATAVPSSPLTDADLDSIAVMLMAGALPIGLLFRLVAEVRGRRGQERRLLRSAVDAIAMARAEEREAIAAELEAEAAGLSEALEFAEAGECRRRAAKVRARG